eukprot:INCI911.1.p2 GENE.INCI911.1~~INCI911.1.p2  ORF type:complete len:120 (+),score=5.01 INCI911.1:45-404(+)
MGRAFLRRPCHAVHSLPARCWLVAGALPACSVVTRFTASCTTASRVGLDWYRGGHPSTSKDARGRSAVRWQRAGVQLLLFTRSPAAVVRALNDLMLCGWLSVCSSPPSHTAHHSCMAIK